MDDLMDLLAYQCPFTGRKRIAGCEDGQLYSVCLGKLVNIYQIYGKDMFFLRFIIINLFMLLHNLGKNKEGFLPMTRLDLQHLWEMWVVKLCTWSI